MNLVSLFLIPLFIVVSPLYGIAETLEQSMRDDKAQSIQRVLKIDDLRRTLKTESSLPQKLTTALTGNEVILLESTVYVTQDYSGDIQVSGELKNTGTFDVSFVKITYTFKDSSNQIIDTDYTYVYGSSKKLPYGIITDTILSNGEVGSYELHTSIPYNLVNSMYSTISFDDYDTEPMGTTIVQSGEVNKQQDYSGDLDLVGEVKNTGNVIAYFVKYVATIKNNNNQVIDVDYTYINGRTVELESGITTDTAVFPNGIASFKVTTDAEYAEVEKMTYKINWDEGSVVTQPRPRANIAPLLPLVLEP